MNADTGRIYRATDEIEAGAARGENIVPISEAAADRIEAAYEAQALFAGMSRQERRLAARQARRKQKIKTSV